MKWSIMTRMYSYAPEPYSRYKKSIDTNSKGDEIVIQVSGARVLKLGRCCLRHVQALVDK